MYWNGNIGGSKHNYSGEWLHINNGWLNVEDELGMRRLHAHQHLSMNTSPGSPASAAQRKTIG